TLLGERARVDRGDPRRAPREPVLRPAGPLRRPGARPVFLVLDEPLLPLRRPQGARAFVRGRAAPRPWGHGLEALALCAPALLHVRHAAARARGHPERTRAALRVPLRARADDRRGARTGAGRDHTSELQSRLHLVCRLLLEKKKISVTRISTPRKKEKTSNNRSN